MEPSEFVVDKPAMTPEQEIKASFTANPKNGVFDIANLLVEKHKIKTIGSEITRELYLYRDGVYIEGTNILKSEIFKLLEEQCGSHHQKEIIERVKDKTLVLRKDLVPPQHLINLENGVFDIKERKLLPHSSDYNFFSKLPIVYKEGADCPAIKKFLSEVLPEADVRVVQEWFGYALYRKYFIKKAIIFVGEGNTGKTTLLRVLQRFIGLDNISGVSLQRISADKFSAAHFYNKAVNIYDDLSFKDINDNGGFKIATGGGIITGEYKFGNQFQFENFAKLTFACNKIPEVEDVNDPAYFERWIILNFRNVAKTPDKFLIDKITTDDEISGLFNFALEGLQRLLATQAFSYEKTSSEIKTEMQRSGSPLAQFVHERMEEAIGEWRSKDDLHTAYVEFSRLRGLPPMTIEEVGRNLSNYADYVLSRKKLVDDKQVNGWRNVRIKPDPLAEDADIPAPVASAPVAVDEIAEVLDENPNLFSDHGTTEEGQ